MKSNFIYNKLKETSGHNVLYRALSRKSLPKLTITDTLGNNMSNHKCFSIGYVQTSAIELEEYIVIETSDKSGKLGQHIVDTASIFYKGILWNLAYQENNKELLRIVQHTSLWKMYITFVHFACMYVLWFVGFRMNEFNHCYIL